MKISFSPLFLLAIFAVSQCEGKPRGKPQKDRCGFSLRPLELIHRLPEGRPVYGVQPVGRDIFVIRDSTPYIEIYDRNTFEAKGNLSDVQLQGPYDMVQSSYGGQASLFLADWFDSENLTEVEVPAGNAAKWSFQEGSPTSVGLTGAGRYSGQTIIVTAAVGQKLKRFSPAGVLLNEVTVQNISRPRQSIQVSAGRYAVCHGYGPPPELHRVCLVNASGQIVKCYGGYSGSGVGQLNIPGRMALNSADCILVADTGNKRIVLLNRNLEHVRDLIGTETGLLAGPYRLHLNEANGRLYVADNTVDSSGVAVSGRVLVFKTNC